MAEPAEVEWVRHTSGFNRFSFQVALDFSPRRCWQKTEVSLEFKALKTGVTGFQCFPLSRLPHVSISLIPTNPHISWQRSKGVTGRTENLPVPESLLQPVRLPEKLPSAFHLHFRRNLRTIPA